MGPNQISAHLRQIASKIDRSNSPDRRLVANELRHLIAAIGGGVIVVHRHGDGTFVEVTSTNEVTPAGDYAVITLPNGDTISFAKSLAVLQANENDELLTEALYNAGLTEAL